jgi:hypothetical protein
VLTLKITEKLKESDHKIHNFMSCNSFSSHVTTSLFNILWRLMGWVLRVMGLMVDGNPHSYTSNVPIEFFRTQQDSFRKTKHSSTIDQEFIRTKIVHTYQDIKLSSEMGSHFAEKPLTSLTVTHVAHTAFHVPTCSPPSCQALFHVLSGPCTCVQ